MEDFSLTIIGCGSALPMHGRHPAAQVVQYDDLTCLIDCGEGTQERLKPAGIKPFRINIILISHLHGDHVFGLPGLLSSLTHLGRKDKLTVYGPPGLTALMDAIMQHTEMKIGYPLEIIEKQPKGLQRITVHGNIEICCFPLSHRITCNGYLLRELTSGKKFKKEMISQYPLLPDQIKALLDGESVMIHGEKKPPSFFLHDPKSPIAYAYCSDTRYDERLIAYLHDVQVIYHETTFSQQMAEMAQETGHSTSMEAGMIARRAGARCLITGHFSSRYKDVSILRDEAAKEFTPVISAEEGKRYNLRQLAEGNITGLDEPRPGLGSSDS